MTFPIGEIRLPEHRPMEWQMPVARAPVKCPVCKGRGTMPRGFYPEESAVGPSRVECRSCKGRGIV